MPLTVALLLLLHPFHVSVCSIRHASDDQTLQITQKIFADDLEEALTAASTNGPVDVLNPPDANALDALIDDYLQNHLRITVNGKEVKAVYLGHEREEMALWCYLEVSNVDSIESVGVRSSILTGTFDDQTNIVHVEYRNVLKSMKLAKDYPNDQVTF
ncbi:MAG: DUF6702 family protein [Tunicatimonas sp.]